MKLEELLDRYVSERDLSPGYVDQLHWCIATLAKHFGRLDVADFSSPLLNRHLRDCRDRGLSLKTCRNWRTMALSLWSAAADLGLAPEPVRRRIMRIRAVPRVPTAWTVVECSRLLQAATALEGAYQSLGISRAAYWRSWVLWTWDTGLRGCDSRSIERDWISSTRRLTIAQHKTGRVVHLSIREGTLAAIDASMAEQPRRALVWPMWSDLRAWRREARRLVEGTGLRGGIGRLRHSSGTAVEHIAPGWGHVHLGNSRAVFERHYLDARLLSLDRPLPPALE